MTDPAGERAPRRRGPSSTGGRPPVARRRPAPDPDAPDDDTARPPRDDDRPAAPRRRPTGSGGNAGRKGGGEPGRPRQSASGERRRGGRPGTASAPSRSGGEPASRDPAGRPARNGAGSDGTGSNPARKSATAARSTGRSGSKSAGKRPAVAPEPEEAAATRTPPDRDPGGSWPMAERSVLPRVLGVPPIAAIGLAAGLTAVGVVVDLTRSGGLDVVFTLCYLTGCVLAVVWVRRTGLFGPLVQPPLLVAVTVPVVAVLAGSPRPGQGSAERLLTLGAPLVNAFPVMALTTAVVLVIGILRMLLQRPL